MSHLAFWSRNDLPDIRLSGDGTHGSMDLQGQRVHASGNTRPTQKHRKISGANLNSSVTMDVEVDNDLQCPICLELYTYPIILPCSHVLCRSPCAEQLFDFNFIRCPVCRDNCYVSGGISSLPRVLALENIIERYKSEQKKEKNSPAVKATSKQTTLSSTHQNGTNENLAKSLSLLNSSVHSLTSLSESLKSDTEIKCQNCKSAATRKRAKKYCTTCESHFCATCLRQTHPNKDPFTNHEFTEPRLNSSDKVSPKCANNRLSGASPGFPYKEIIDTYCTLCTQPFSSGSEERLVHNSHPVLPIEHAYRDFKISVEENAEKLSLSQSKVVTSLKDLKDGLKDVQYVLTRRRDEINMQCDMLLAEIENKRSYFLADLEYEERIHQNSLEDCMKRLEKVLGASQGLQSYVQDVLGGSEKAPFLEIANTLNERIQKATLDCESAGTLPPLDTESLNYKVVDCRREKVLLNELQYLSPPSTPIVDVSRCSRSENSVVLALCPPTNVHEVVDQYDIHFCSEEQKNVELEETIIVKNSVEDSSSTKISANASGVLVLVLENLCRSTTYYFCLTAGNAVGKSGSSEVVQCTTLAESENLIPAPIIMEPLCKQFTSSVQIFSSSPVDVAAEQKISHFLLYRQLSQNRVWKCVSMYGREEHRVFGLVPSTEYEFVILAYNQRGECQLSNKIVQETQSSSNF